MSQALGAPARWIPALAALLLAAAITPAAAVPDPAITPAQARALAKEAFLFAYPMVENYNRLYQLAVDKNSDQYKGPMNEIANVPRVFGPKDSGMALPEADMLTSYLVMDLRAEPLVVSLPPVEPDRYGALQLVDLYSHNTDYVGTRRDGNDGGNVLIAGPSWKGDVPAGIRRVVRSDTDLMFSQFRTQLRSAQDLEAAKKIQAGYKVQPLSRFAESSAPPAAPAIDFPPITRAQIEPDVFRYANFLLQFSPAFADELALRERFKRIGVEIGAPWPPELPAPVLQAIELGRQDGVKALNDSALKVSNSKGLFGTHQAMEGKYFERALGARLNLHGNSAEEVVSPIYQLNPQGQPLDAGAHDYRIRFAKDHLPPVDAFWSITMYDGKTHQLIDNPIDRPLLDSTMLPQFKRNPDGGLTLYLQHASPGAGLQANWLPAPKGPMVAVLRLYRPQAAALADRWKAPQIEELPLQ